MKTLNVQLPEKVAAEVARLVQGGWFRSEDELIRVAVAEYVRTHRAELQEQQQRADINWAVAESKPDG